MARIKVRKGMPSVALDQGRVHAARPRALRRPGLRAAAGRDRQDHRGGVGRLSRLPQGAAHQAGRPALCRSGLRALGRLARRRATPSPAPSGGRNRPASRSRILLVNGSSRSDQTCPGEMSKTFRLVEIAQRVIERERGFEVELLDLSLLTSQYGRQILPCKACVSTAHAALPLALLLLSQPCAGPGQRLDGRDLSRCGRPRTAS